MSTYRRHLDNVYRTLTRPSENIYQTHAGLWFDRFIEKQDRKSADSRINLIKYVSTLSIPETYKTIYGRWKNTLETEGAKTRIATVKGRMIVGLGSESVLETSICLHRTYGVPYIPGSALKGLAASYAHQRIADPAWNKGGDAYRVVFGDTNDSGYITFFDAFYIPDTGRPRPKQPLYPDVITVHHKEYYQGKNNAPADWDSPTPIPFLSVTGNYLIALAAPALGSNSPWLTRTFEILGYALKDMGIGAKTSSGYGRLELEVDDRDTPPTNSGSVQTAQSKLVERIRPKIPHFREGQEITGSVVAPKDELRQRAPSGTRAFLRYQSFSTRDVLISVSAEEAQNWKPGETRICLFVQEEERDGSIVLICQPRPSKKKKG